MSRPAHHPVMVGPVLDVLDPSPGKRIVDATLGLGGHAEAILRRLGPEGELIGLDRDAQMLAHAEERLRDFGSSAQLVHARFSYLKEVLLAQGIERVDGILMDLGVCSAQLDERVRGFSFQTDDADVPLDMRMDTSRGEPASRLLERLDEAELSQLLREGGVPAPGRTARALREKLPIQSTKDLLEALRGVKLPRRRHHPATLVFQALRMAVNEETAELDAGLEAAVDCLAPGGRLAVISYHSGEDRRVKEFLNREARGCICPPDLPRCGCGRSPRFKILVKGEAPTHEEVASNPRARSARLRGAERW